MAEALLNDDRSDSSTICEIVSSASSGGSSVTNFCLDEDLPPLVEIKNKTASKSRDMASPRLNFYERGIPWVIQSRDRDDDGIFHPICLRFELLEQGKDSLQQYATEYGILFPCKIDSSLVTRFHVDLFLQDHSIVHVRAESYEMVTLNHVQVKLVKSFTKWLFDLVLGRSLDGTATSEAKGYYVVPLLHHQGLINSGQNFESLIDWDTLDSSTNSGFRYKSSYANAEQIPEQAFATTARNRTDPRIDTLVTYKEVPYLVVSACAKELVACKVYRAVSSLSQQCGDEVPKKLGLVFRLPAEECISYKNLNGRLYRGALRLPSVLQKLEMSLSAAELRDRMQVTVSPTKILEALTSRACGLAMSYESLELLGDSVLKLTVGTHVYSRHPGLNSEQLGVELYNVVSNKSLAACAQAQKLHLYMFAEMFSPNKWLAPGEIPSKDLSRPASLQLLSTRTLADVVEALLGACVLEGDLGVAAKAMRWFQIPIQWPQTPPDIDISTSKTKLKANDVDELQQKLCYKFNDERLLVAAFGKGTDCLTYGRLEFLGDAILDYLTTLYLVKTFPSLSAGQLNVLKQASVNREHYSCLCIQHGLHHYVQKSCPDEEFSAFTKCLLEEIKSGKIHELSFGIPGQSSPKVLGDVIQTLAAAVYIDSGFNIELFWKVYKPLLEPFATPENVILHPVAQLDRLCKERNLSLNIQCLEADGLVHADIIVDNETLGRFQHQERRVARRLAAMQALQHLL